MAQTPKEAAIIYLKKQEKTEDHAEIERLMNAAVALVERETGWSLSKKTVNEVHHGDGGTILFPNRAPLVSVTSLTINGEAIAASTDVFDPGYFIHGNAIVLRGYSFSEGFANIELTISAGFDTIPEDFVQKLVEITAFWFTRKASIAQKSTQFDRETTSWEPSEVTDGVKRWLGNVKRRVF